MGVTYIHGTSKEEQDRLSALNRITNHSFVDYLGIEDDIRICDFGCGTGDLVHDITERYPNALITGLEISAEQCAQAFEINRNSSTVELINVNIFANQLPDNCFDITYCRYLLEHVDDPVRAVQEMVRVTKPGGKIVAQENDLHNVLYYPDIPGHDHVMQRFCDLQVQMGGDPFIGRKLFNIFKQAGLQTINLHYEPEIYTENDPDKYKAWMSNSLNIFCGAREMLVKKTRVDEVLFDKVCHEFKSRIQEPVGVALFHWNRIKGCK